MYESFYHLKEKPFHLNPDPRFFFASTGHNRVLAYLRYGVREGEGFIVVTGEIGTGKTTLIHLLLEELDEKKDNFIVAHIATTQPDASELLAMVANAFGIDFEGLSKAVLLTRLDNFLHEQSRQGKRALLIIDDAENFSRKGLEELLMLTNFLNNHKAVLQGFLVGQIEFRGTLQADHLEALRQRIIASCHLGPLELEETQKYIEHRLQVAGWQGDPSFTPEAFRLIQDYSGGIPRRLNNLCDRILLVGYLEETHEITPALVSAVIQELRSEHFGISREAGEALEQSKSPRSRRGSSAESVADSPSSSSIEQRLSNLEARFESIEEVIVMVRAAIKAVMSQRD
ncbi:MAG: XrtA-associated ATPase [Gammaproteobacteria bacterium]